MDGSGACAPGEELGADDVPANYTPEHADTYMSPPSTSVSKRPSQHPNAKLQLVQGSALKIQWLKLCRAFMRP